MHEGICKLKPTHDGPVDWNIMLLLHDLCYEPIPPYKYARARSEQMSESITKLLINS